MKIMLPSGVLGQLSPVRREAALTNSVVGPGIRGS